MDCGCAVWEMVFIVEDVSISHANFLPYTELHITIYYLGKWKRRIRADTGGHGFGRGLGLGLGLHQ